MRGGKHNEMTHCLDDGYTASIGDLFTSGRQTEKERSEAICGLPLPTCGS